MKKQFHSLNHFVKNFAGKSIIMANSKIKEKKKK